MSPDAYRKTDSYCEKFSAYHCVDTIYNDVFEKLVYQFHENRKEHIRNQH